METSEQFWNDWMYWQIVEDYEIDEGVQHMSHGEIVGAILDDLLRVKLEFAKERPHGLHRRQLFRFLKTDIQRKRVLEAFCDPRVQDLIIEYKEDPQFINLNPDPIMLQAAMDIAGCWYEGYEMPDGVTTLSEKGAALIEELGVDEFALHTAHTID